mmetsp:Transcript_5419/g.21162  ORF Transcript_5419/g.21162 Transcript_5419/m.21162 type:complete len:233 (+) Transcript_5419:773-1471(+)
MPYEVRSSNSPLDDARSFGPTSSPCGRDLPFVAATRRNVSFASSIRPAFTEYKTLSGTIKMHAINPSNGAAEINSKTRHECRGSTIHASADSNIDPSVQNASMYDKRAPRFSLGKNSMNNPYATGTPPKPTPTRHLKNNTLPKLPPSALPIPAASVVVELNSSAGFRPRASLTTPHAGAPRAIPTNTTLVSAPSASLDTPNSHRIAGPMKLSSIISIASAAHAKPTKHSAWI